MRPGNTPKNRQKKVKFLKDLRDGRISLKDFPEPITGMIIICNGQCWDMRTGKQLELNTVEKLANVPTMY